jgi:hypothetical protein
MKALLFISMIMPALASAQIQSAGVEQYYYLQNRTKLSMGPIAYLQTKDNWYVEARYNYEEVRTFSFYTGKAFSHTGDFSYTLIPMIGGVTGRFNGASIALHAATEAKRFFVCSQSQYSISGENEIENFYFNWAELGYEFTPRIHAGVSLQHTRLFSETQQNIVDFGFFTGYTIGQWTFPVYAFNVTSNNNFFVFGIIWEWERQ